MTTLLTIFLSVLLICYAWTQGVCCVIKHHDLTSYCILSGSGVLTTRRIIDVLLETLWKIKKCHIWERRKRWCQLHYIVRMVSDIPHLVLIIYVQSRHVEKNGFPCHGHVNPTIEHQMWLHHMHLSECVKHWVASLLFVGVSPTEINDKHGKMLASRQTHVDVLQMGRDSFLTKRNIIHQTKQLDDPWYQIHEDDSLNIPYWVEKKVDVFLLNWDTIILRITMRWQV